MSTTSVLAWVFWSGVAATVYAYAAFPALASILGRSGRRRTPQAGPLETVTVIIPAYNEAESIDAKIRNVLASDYPRGNLDVIVVSDASTDGTNEIAARFEAEGVRLLLQPRRQGKTAGLNRAIDLARGEIVVFTDANALYGPDAIRALAGYFHDPRTGLVTGYTRYRVTESGAVAEVTNLYTSLEWTIKRGESRWGCCVGADGAIFAMRRGLYRRLQNDDINDFVLPLGVVDQGAWCTFADDVFCSESPGKDLESEFRRQSRISNRTLRGLWRNAHLLNPFRFPRFAFFLFSHKVIRFLVPVFLVLSVCCLPFLVPAGGIYPAAAVAASVGAALAIFSRLRPPVAGARSLPARVAHVVDAFVTMNLAMLNGWRRFLSGRTDVTWQHDRSAA